VPPQAWNDEPAGRGRARLYDCGPLRLCTAGAVQAAARWGWERRDGPCAPPSRRVWGASPCAATQARPVQGTAGESQEKRPALTPGVLSTLGVARAVPRWGQPEEGPAADQPLPTTLWSERAPRRAP
jgi:hypothetical protein